MTVAVAMVCGAKRVLCMSSTTEAKTYWAWNFLDGTNGKFAASGFSQKNRCDECLAWGNPSIENGIKCYILLYGAYIPTKKYLISKRIYCAEEEACNKVHTNLTRREKNEMLSLLVIWNLHSRLINIETGRHDLYSYIFVAKKPQFSMCSYF